MPALLDNQKFIDSVRESMTTEKVWVFCKAGTMPLEWPKNADGSKQVDDEQVTVGANGKIFRTNKVEYRNIDTRITNDQGIGAQSAGYMELDLKDTSHHLESDAKFLERIKDWIANSGDPRIEANGVRVEQGNPFPLPFVRWDELKPVTVVDMTANMLGDDLAANEQLLRQYAGYELRRDKELGGPRQEVLDGLEMLYTASGDESGDSAVLDAN